MLHITSPLLLYFLTVCLCLTTGNPYPGQHFMHGVRPQVECPPSDDGMDTFACPSPDSKGRLRCIASHALCDGFPHCPKGEDEDKKSCLFYRSVSTLPCLCPCHHPRSCLLTRPRLPPPTPVVAAVSLPLPLSPRPFSFQGATFPQQTCFSVDFQKNFFLLRASGGESTCY